MYPKLFQKIIRKEKASLVVEAVILFPIFLMLIIAFMALIQINTLSTYFRHKAEVASLEVITFNLVGEELLEESVFITIDKKFNISYEKFRQGLLEMPLIRNENLEVIMDLRGNRIQIDVVYNMPFCLIKLIEYLKGLLENDGR
ncbi:hypothetical protein AZF37_00850 [endosymbiont 'TC1' of Trimyema compressum]|uniref:hypothetical protein n=1 Tax=endosymbiont 'TC1' of Trimyema compressum TaxID=243899 RepID=UPI0007F11010|nr:hypothetical protein [endosymbiont 'TC1' of Trimyema compressum]AMP19919.1 hypothetical protein AZF37_00850 [endosymbiont 'TC1' of Trimyema compressum]